VVTTAKTFAISFKQKTFLHVLDVDTHKTKHKKVTKILWQMFYLYATEVLLIK